MVYSNDYLLNDSDLKLESCQINDTEFFNRRHALEIKWGMNQIINIILNELMV